MTGNQSMLTAQSNPQEAPIPAWPGALALRCPNCKQAPPCPPPESGSPASPCGFEFSYVDGILRALPEERELHFRRFMAGYERVRAKEGRGSPSQQYYLALPFSDLNGNNDWQWAIRARTYRHLVQHVLCKLEKAYPTGCDVLDIGAGNCWLSYRLAQRGHRPVALDLLVNPWDGLGAGRHYLSHLDRPFVRVQGEMDNLPFPSGQFDIAIFNAALHYSANYEQTLREVVRCLRRPGYLVVADTPFYPSEQDGQTMVVEKQSMFIRKFGVSAGDMQSREYLTPQALGQLAEALHLRWKVHKPWYGVGWMLRPVKAGLLGRRKPSKFYLLVAEIGAQEREA
jgi:ubiquinone/menaquinone biosynthesis C-methylase UbiE